MADQTTTPQGTHHFVLTLEKHGYASFTSSGTYTPPLGMTRQDAFAAIYADATAADPRMQQASVTFFALEHNEL